MTPDRATMLARKIMRPRVRQIYGSAFCDDRLNRGGYDYLPSFLYILAAINLTTKLAAEWLRSPTSKGSEEGVDYADAFADRIEALEHLPDNGEVKALCENCGKQPATTKYDGDEMCEDCAKYCARRDFEEDDMPGGF